MPRASDAQKAERLNRARTVLRTHALLPETAERLARDWSVSKRQAYRYLQQAQKLKQPVAVEEAKVSFTVKLSRRLVEKLRRYAASTGWTLSEIVSRAVQSVLQIANRAPKISHLNSASNPSNQCSPRAGRRPARLISLTFREHGGRCRT
jgi:hypothetical protein